jgi:hypothetical protein
MLLNDDVRYIQTNLRPLLKPLVEFVYSVVGLTEIRCMPPGNRQRSLVYWNGSRHLPSHDPVSWFHGPGHGMSGSGPEWRPRRNAETRREGLSG